MIVSAAHAGQRLDAYLASEMAELSRSRIRKLIDDGHVTVNGKTPRPSAKLKEGDDVTVFVPPPEPMELEPEDIPLNVVYEDADVIVIDKPAGMVVHPSAGHSKGTLVGALLGHTADLSGVGGVARPGIVHRLDKDTSGLVIVAKNDAAHHSLSAQLQARTLRRTYIAVVKGQPKQNEGMVEGNIGRHKTHRKKMAVLREGGKPAVTRYRVLQWLDGHTALEVTLETGRTHQIRAHMFHINHPVAGDETYGRGDKRRLIKRQALHAWKITFIHPSTGETMSFTAPLPGDMAHLIKNLGGDPAPYMEK